MNTTWTEMLERLQNMFPESDRSILSVLLAEGDVAARYIAQVHDLTVNEASELIELVIGRSYRTQSRAFAAE